MQPRQFVSIRTHFLRRFMLSRRANGFVLLLLAASLVSYVTFRTVDAQSTIIGPGVAQVGSSAPKSNASSSKAGSILFFHKYVSDSTRPHLSNTVVTLTNTNPNDGVTVRLIAMHDCLLEDKFINLAANQSRSLLLSKEFPDSIGALVAVAVTPTGAPTQFNWLIGSATVRDWVGNEGSYNAFAVAKRSAGAVTGTGTTFDLNFDGKQYDQLPQIVAVDNLQSVAADLTLYSPTATLADETGVINAELDATLFDAKGKAFPSRITGYGCGLFTTAADLWLDQPIPSILKAGQTGWARFQATDRSDPRNPKALPILGVSASTVTGKPQTGALTMQVLEWLEKFTISLKAKTPNIPAAPETPTTNQPDSVGGATGASESKAGSILLYPRFVNSKAGSTILNLTNTHPTQKARVRLFANVITPDAKVDEMLVTVEPQQSVSIKTSNLTSGQRGWVTAGAIDSGAQAIKFNYLIGSAYVTETGNVTTVFNALAVGKNSEGAVPRDEDDNKTSTLNFNDQDYDRLPATWGLAGLPNQNDFNSYLSYNRFSLSQIDPPSTRGTGSVTVVDKSMTSYAGLIGAAEINLEDLGKIRLSPTMPATSIQGNAGWLKLSMTTPSLAVISNFATTPIATIPPDGWVGGLTGSGNLHILTTTASHAMKIPAGNPNNQPPIAEFAALAFEVEARSSAGTIVRLDGSPSNDPDPDDSLTYQWYDNGQPISTTILFDYRLSIGVHELKLVVTDTSGEASDPYLQSVEVQDKTAPTISRIPSAINITTTGTTAVVNYPMPVAYDSIDGAVNVTATPPSGSTFPLGLRTVTFTATDRAGNKATAEVDVNVTQGSTASQTGGVASSTAPFLPNLNDQYLQPGEVRKIVLKADDADGDPVSFRLTSLAANVTLGNYDPIARQATLFIGPFTPSTAPRQFRIQVSDNKQQSYATVPFQIAVSPTPNDDNANGGGNNGGGRSNRPPNAVIAPLPATINATEIDGIVLQLDGSLSNDPDVDGLTFSWNVDGQAVAQTAITELKLGLGTHVIVLTVKDGRGGTGTATSTVQVLPRALAIRSISPARIPRDTTALVVISGTGFSERSTVFINGSGVLADGYLSRTESSISAYIRVTSSAAQGTRDVIVINPDGKTATLRAGLVIQ